MAKIKVATKADVAKGKVKQVKVGEESIALYHTDSDEWFATSDICTHEECNLSSGGGKLEGHVTECDCHGSKFDIKTGAVVLPPAVEPIKTFKVEVKGEEVFVEG